MNHAARSTVAAAAALIAACLVSGCGPSVPPLANAHASFESLAAAALRAVEQRDVASLRALALSEREFRDHVWPELPAARPERNLPFAYVWRDLRQKSEGALAATLARVGGQRLHLVKAGFSGETSQYRTYLVHRETRLTVRDAGGTKTQLRLFGSVLEKSGRFKIFSFVVD